MYIVRRDRDSSKFMLTVDAALKMSASVGAL